MRILMQESGWQVMWRRLPYNCRGFDSDLEGWNQDFSYPKRRFRKMTWNFISIPCTFRTLKISMQASERKIQQTNPFVPVQSFQWGPWWKKSSPRLQKNKILDVGLNQDCFCGFFRLSGHSFKSQTHNLPLESSLFKFYRSPLRPWWK